MKEAFLALVRLGIGNAATEKLPDRIDWDKVEALAEKQGMLGILYDAVQELKSSRGSSQEILPPLITWLRWIGKMQLEDERYNHQWYESCKMALLFHQNNIRTYILKGFVLSECYPKPQHRISSDVDCFLLPEEGDEEVWEKGNKLMEEGGFKVERGFYKNSAFYMPGFAVENHRYMVPFRGNKTLMVLEKMLQGMLRDSALKRTKFEGTELWHPPVMVSALFLIEHAYSHFLHEGLTWRHVLDWVMFSRKHKQEIDWNALDALIDEFKFRKFYDAYQQMGRLLLGEITEDALSKPEKKMLADIWAPLDLHETLHGVKGKLGLVGNTWRARWKYHYFSTISMPHALWIQTTGFLFDKNPTLN